MSRVRYAALTPAQLDEVTAIAEWGTTRLLDLWVEDERLSEADLQRLRGIGAVRALDGRPLPGVLRAYRLAGMHVSGLVEELGAGRLDLGDAMAFARLWMASIDSMSDALSAGHDAAAGRLSDDRDRALGDLLDDLLVGRQVTRTGLADRSRELGVTLDARLGLLVLTRPGGDPPGPSSLWFDGAGKRLPGPLYPGFDTLGTLAHLRRTGHDHSWLVLTQKVIEKEFALSGSEQNPDLTGKNTRLTLGRIRPGAPEPVEKFKQRGEDFVVADTLEELVAGMNRLTPDAPVALDDIRREVVARDRELDNGFTKDGQVAAIHNARRHLGDRLGRTATPTGSSTPPTDP